MANRYPETFPQEVDPQNLDKVTPGYYWVRFVDNYGEEYTSLVRWTKTAPKHGQPGTFWFMGSELNSYPEEFKEIEFLVHVPVPNKEGQKNGTE